MLSTNANQFHVVERRARRRAHAGSKGLVERFRQHFTEAAEQTDLAEAVAGTEIIQHSFIAPVPLSYFYKTQFNDVVVVGRVALTKDSLTRVDPNQVDLILKELGYLRLCLFLERVEDR